MDCKSEKIKEILDRECYQNWHAKRCNRRDKIPVRDCWVCTKNDELVKEIADTIQEASNA